MKNRVYDYKGKKNFNKTVTENEYLLEWEVEGDYNNWKGTAYFMDFLLEEFNLDIEDLRKIANLKEDESIKIYGMAEYFTVTNRGT